jgi:hypothetical protein
MKINLDGGWEIKLTSTVGKSGFTPNIYNKQKHILIKIPHEYLGVFGFVTHGCELGTGSMDDFVPNFEEMNTAIIDILTEQLFENKSNPTYWTIREFLKDMSSSKRFQTDKTAIKKCLLWLDEGFQELWKLEVKNRDDETTEILGK